MTSSGCCLKAGFGCTDVTPKPGVRLGGYGVRERPGEEVLDRLQANAIVLEQNGLKAVVINLDWICIEEYVVDRIREGINKSTGIPNHNITVCTTHSHSVPNTLNFWGWGDTESEYIDSVIPEIVRSAEIADSKLQEVSVGIAETESLVGVNRRGTTVEGNVCFNADPQGFFDPAMTVIKFTSKEGVDVGIIIHYGAHGTAMGCNRLISRDWCGVMKDRVQSQYDKAAVLFLNGAIGDVGPRTNRRVGDGLSAGGGDGIHSVREVGYRGATDAIRALLSIKELRADLKLAVHTEDIFIPYAPLTPLDVAEKEKAKWEPRKDEFGTAMCEYKHNCAVIDAHKKEILKGRNFTQTVIALGPVAIVPMPGEMFSGISLRIRRSSPYQHTLCCSVTNGSLSYLPTREARHRGGYETWVGRAGGAYLLADNIDDALVSENLKLLKAMKS